MNTAPMKKPAVASKPRYRRILLKLSGEALGGVEGQGINPEAVHDMACQVAEVQQLGVEVVIVVGGAKVLPQRVEEILRGVPGLADARVYGLPSAITGELVAVEAVLTDPLPEGSTPESIRAAALAACRSGLEPHSVPRIFDIVRMIATNPSGKISRRPTSPRT